MVSTNVRAKALPREGRRPIVRGDDASIKPRSVRSVIAEAAREPCLIS